MKTYQRFFYETLNMLLNHGGWWYNHATKRLFNVSSDGGQGDHMGFLWACLEAQNGKKLGLNDDDIQALMHYYGIDKNENDNSYGVGEWTQEGHDATRKLLKLNTRVLIGQIGGKAYVGVDTFDGSDDALRHAQVAIEKLQSMGNTINPDSVVYWDTRDDDKHYETDFEEFIAAKHPRQLHQIY